MRILLSLVVLLFIYLAILGYTIKQSDQAVWYVRFIVAPFMITVLSVSVLVVEGINDLKKKFK